MLMVDVVQGTPEWRQARVGSLGASRVHEAIARTRNGWAASRASVLSDIVAERLTGAPAEIYVTEAMGRGQALEPDARAAYAFQRDVDVELGGASGTRAWPAPMRAQMAWSRTAAWWRSSAQARSRTFPRCSPAPSPTGT